MRPYEQKEILTDILELVVNCKVCPETPIHEWPNIILQAHNRGYLYIKLGEDGVESAVMAYRIPIYEEHASNYMPKKEFGNKLYVAWACSESKNMLTLLKMLRGYLKLFPLVDEVYYHHRGSNTDLRCLKFKKSRNVNETEIPILT